MRGRLLTRTDTHTLAHVVLDLVFFEYYLRALLAMSNNLCFGILHPVLSARYSLLVGMAWEWVRKPLRWLFRAVVIVRNV